MRSVTHLTRNPAEQNAEAFLAATNAYAEQLAKRGLKTEYMSAQNAKKTYKGLIKLAASFANPSSAQHEAARNAFGEQLSSEAMADLESIGSRYLTSAMGIAQKSIASGMPADTALDAAYNSIAGNPVFDHFGNLNYLSGQLYEDMTFLETFMANGDALSVPLEAGSTGQDTSRFRIPVEQVVGSSKIGQGDINPQDFLRSDTNRTKINLFNEFKNAITHEQTFSISQAMRDNALGYQKTVAPALAGFILQNRYFLAVQKQIMKLAELVFVDGSDVAGNYTPNVGGSYGVLSPSIQLQLASWNTANPAAAVASDWAANTTKLIQKIQNFSFVQTTVAAPLNVSGDPALMYSDLVRLFTLAAQSNVDFKAKNWVLYTPTTFYGLMAKYPSGGTFNKNLKELVESATGKIINAIDIVPSSLMNYRAANSYGSTAGAFNYFLLVAQGAEMEKKPVIMPGQTAMPVVESENVSASVMSFRSQYVFGGPMVTQFGGAFLMEISKP